MLIKSSAPCRISFFGGGTDCEPYLSKYGGEILSMAINIRQEIIVEQTFGGIGSIFAPKNVNLKLAEIILQAYNSYGNCNVRSSFDGEIGAGLGSSGAFTMALLGALARKGNLRKKNIVKEACRLENEFHFTGIQDHVSAMTGGLNRFRLGKDNDEMDNLTKLLANKLTLWLQLFYIGQKRVAIVNKQSNLTEEKKKVLDHMKAFVRTGEYYLVKEEFDKFGLLMHENWELKKQSNPLVTNDIIDEIYSKGRKAGALGGKLLGSGGGGYFLFITPPPKQEAVRKALNLKEVSFMPDYQGLSTRAL